MNSLKTRAWLVPIVIVLAVVPLVTIIHVYDCKLEVNPWFSIGGKLYDFFLYYKAFLLRIIGIVLLFVLSYIVSFYDRSYLNKYAIAPFIAVGIFLVGSFVSSILSDHRQEAFFGGYEQFEGWFILLAYIVCFYFAFGYIRTEKYIRFILDALLIGAAIIGVLGTFQAFGLDWIQSTPAKYIITPELIGQIDLNKFNIKLNFGEGTSYVTLYNPNYVGTYVSLILPYTIYIMIKGTGLCRHILAGITSVLLVITLVASGSLAGVFGLLVGSVVFGILIFPSIKKHKKLLIAGLVIILAAGCSIAVIQPSFLSKLLPGSGKENYYVDTMTAEDLTVNIVTGSGKNILVNIDPDKTKNDNWSLSYGINDIISVTDKSGKNVETTTEEITNSIAISEVGYEPLKFSIERRWLDAGKLTAFLSEYNKVAGISSEITVSSEEGINEEQTSVDLLNVIDGNFTWSFTVINNRLYIYNDFGRLDTLDPVARQGFERRYYFGSRRGYIWSRTLPLIYDHMLLGVGADNFVYAFPNDDYVGKKYMNYATQTITKPHNIYLQIWIQDGFPALLGFVALYIIFIIRAVRLSFSKKYKDLKEDTSFKMLIMVTAAATTGYMIVGLINDSTITVAPIYWVLLGVGYALDAVIRKNHHA